MAKSKAATELQKMQAELAELRAIKSKAVASGAHVEIPEYKLKPGHKNVCVIYSEKVQIRNGVKLSAPSINFIDSGAMPNWAGRSKDKKGNPVGLPRFAKLGITVHAILHWPETKDSPWLSDEFQEYKELIEPKVETEQTDA